MENSLFGRLSPENLLHGKALSPLEPRNIEDLNTVEKLKDLDGYSEQDVREDIIVPILRALGYQKESMFSIEREKTLWIANKRLAIDYSLTLWEEDFWIIEAKKPSVTNGKFVYEQVWQALQYAIHPKINAALLVLCDGHALEVFDREESLEVPVLRVEKADLVRKFDQLRALLSPLQAWFFQKRRVMRLVDKVFDREFNIGRMNEFEKLIQQRLRNKRQRAVENLRALSKLDNDNFWIRDAEAVELIEALLPLSLSWPMIEAMSANLIKNSEINQFSVMHRIFPNHPNAVTDTYFANALHYLMRFEEKSIAIGWLPSWLDKGAAGDKIVRAIERLIELTLTGFREEAAWSIVLLQAAAARRLSKAFMVLIPEANKIGQLHHLARRFMGDEFDFEQIVSSPERHSLLELDNIVRIMTSNFILSNSDERGNFLLTSAKHRLQQMWQNEVHLLQSTENYAALLREQNLNEAYPTEAAAVCYDMLGHQTLCVINRFPKWKEHVLNTLRLDLDTLVSFGSWQARDWLGIDAAQIIRPTEKEYADRFFFGNLDLAHKLRDLYNFR